MGGSSFGRDERLVKGSDYNELRDTGKKTHTEHFIIVTRISPTRRSRLGITASTRVGNAVQRNRIKRLLREFFRLNKDKFGPPIDVHIIARKGSVGLKYAEVCKEIEGRIFPVHQ